MIKLHPIRYVERRLGIKMLLALFVSVSIVMLTIIFFNINAQTKGLKDNFIASGESVESLVHASIKYPMAQGDPTVVQRQLSEMGAAIHGLDILICRTDGDVVFASDAGMVGRNVPALIVNGEARAALKELMAGGRGGRSRTFDERVGTRNYLLNFAAVPNEPACYQCHESSKKINGGIVLRQSMDEAYAVVSALRDNAILIGVIGIAAITLLLYFLVSRMVVGPAVAYSKKAEQLSAGDLTVRVDVRGKDEVSVLGEAINRVAANLRMMFAQIKDVTTTVTDTVIRVTEDLGTSSGQAARAAMVQRDAVAEVAANLKAIDVSLMAVSEGTESLSASSQETYAAIVQISEFTTKVAESVNSFSTTASAAASSVENMVSSIREISASVGNLSVLSENTVQSLGEMKTVIAEVGTHAAESSGLAERVTSEASGRGLSAADSAIAGMNKIQDSVGATVQAIRRLSLKSKEIGGIVDVITDIAEQTDLLAVNAAILSAAAGEYGKPFAVIADEIKKLSEKTAQSTQEIGTLIHSVQSETQSSIKTAEAGMRCVEEGGARVRETQLALTSIQNSSYAAAEKAKLIRKAAESESVAMQGIVKAIIGMNDQLAQISAAAKKQSEGSLLILQAMKSILDGSTQVRSATSQQAESARQVSEALGSMAQETVRISGETARQSQKSKEIVVSMESLRRSAAESVHVAGATAAAVKALEAGTRTLLEELRRFQV